MKILDQKLDDVVFSDHGKYGLKRWRYLVQLSMGDRIVDKYEYTVDSGKTWEEFKWDCDRGLIYPGLNTIPRNEYEELVELGLVKMENKLKCECGYETQGFANHSSWCDLYEEF